MVQRQRLTWMAVAIVMIGLAEAVGITQSSAGADGAAQSSAGANKAAQSSAVREMRFKLEVLDEASGELVSRLRKGPAGTVGLIDGVPVIGLENRFDGGALTIDQVDHDAPTILRELARQAFLFAAREHLGWRTRDQNLGETLPKDLIPEAGRLAVVVAQQDAFNVENRPHCQIGVAIYHEQGKTCKLLFSRTYRFVGHHFEALPEFAREMARAAAVDFPERLRELPVPVQNRPQNTPAAFPAELQAERFVMDDLVQYARIRRLHDWIAAHGPHPAAYRELAYAYGHLGVLTEHLWCDISVVCKARALLYALQDFPATETQPEANADSPSEEVAATPQLAETEIQRAYLLAICGRHRDAIRLLENYKTAQKQAVHDQPAPEQNAPKSTAEKTATADDSGVSVEQLELLTRRIAFVDLQGLAQLETTAQNETLQALASFYHLLLLETTFQREPVQQQGLAAWQFHPTCSRVVDSLALNRDVVGLRRAVGLMGRTMNLSWETHDATLQSLGPAFRQALKSQTFGQYGQVDFAAQKKLMTQLMKPADQQEARAEWNSAILGRLLLERAFVLAEADIAFLANYLGVDPSESLVEHRDLSGDHPLFPMVEILALRAAHHKPFNDRLNYVGPSWTMSAWRHYQLRMVVAAHQRRIDNQPTSYRSTLYERYYEPSYGGVTLYNQSFGGYSNRDNQRYRINRLDLISPHAELAVLEKLLSLPDKSDTNYAPIEAKAGNSPLVLAALADRYAQAKRSEDQLRILLRLCELSPTEANLVRLARLYFSQDDFENGLPVVQRVIDHPNKTLLGVHVESDLAKWYLTHEEPDLALTHARNAAASWSAYSLLTLKNVLAKRGEYEAADEVFEGIARRYPSHALEWYKWCRFHGLGREELAQELTVAYFEGYGVPAPLSIRENISEYYLLAGEYEKAVEVMAHNDPYRNFHPRHVLLGVALADRVKRIPFRNMMLRHLVAQHDRLKAEKPETLTPELKFAVLLNKVLLEERAELLTLQKIQEFGEGHSAEMLDTPLVVAAHFLEKRGEQDLALELLERAAYNENFFVPATVYAREMLRQQGRQIGPSNTGITPHKR